MTTNVNMVFYVPPHAMKRLVSIPYLSDHIQIHIVRRRGMPRLSIELNTRDEYPPLTLQMSNDKVSFLTV